MSRTIADLTVQEVREAVRAVMEDKGDSAPHRLLDPVAERLGVGRYSAAPGYLKEHENRTFYNRVKQSLDKLAGEGGLVKVGAGTRRPDGKMLSRHEVWYYTPEAFAAARAAREERDAAALAQKTRWERIAVRLLAADVTLRQDGSLSAEAWERLLEVTGL